jgi:hypothetical protein
LLSKVPGIGEKLARRILDELHTDTLEGLEMAVYDGRLSELPGFGRRRVAMVRAALAEMLGRRRRAIPGRPESSIETLLDVDGNTVKKPMPTNSG